MQVHRIPKQRDWKKFRKNRKEIYIQRDIRLEEYKAENRSNPTPSEVAFQSILNSLKSEYKLDWVTQRCFRRPNHPESFYLIDFYVQYPYKTAFEIDGASHNNKQAYDAERDMAMLNAGVLVIRITNDQIRDDKEGVIALVRETFDNRLAIESKHNKKLLKRIKTMPGHNIDSPIPQHFPE